jgi:hypothetical protein
VRSELLWNFLWLSSSRFASVLKVGRHAARVRSLSSSLMSDSSSSIFATVTVSCVLRSISLHASPFSCAASPGPRYELTTPPVKLAPLSGIGGAVVSSAGSLMFAGKLTLVGICGHTYVVIRIVHQLGDIDMKLGGSVAACREQCTHPNVDICTVALPAKHNKSMCYKNSTGHRFQQHCSL